MIVRFFNYSLDTLSRISMLVCRYLFRHHGSWPYLSQSSFIHLSRGFQPLHPSEGTCNREMRAVIHVRTDKLPKWVEENAHHNCSIILIVGNADDPFPHELKLPTSVRHCFAQNLTQTKNPLHSPIPIGLEDRRFGRLGMKFLYKLPLPKKVHKVIIPPMSPTNPIRKKIIEELESNSYNSNLFEVDSHLRGWIRYFIRVRKFKFVLCLEGNGYDTHRLWETIYMNSFPVLIRSNFSKVIEDLGLPVLVVDSIKEISSELLNSHLRKFADIDARNIPELWMPYWKTRILHSF